MKRTIAIAVLCLIAGCYLSSCSRAITPYEAAHGKAKCGRRVK